MVKYVKEGKTKAAGMVRTKTADRSTRSESGGAGLIAKPVPLTSGKNGNIARP